MVRSRETSPMTKNRPRVRSTVSVGRARRRRTRAPVLVIALLGSTAVLRTAIDAMTLLLKPWGPGHPEEWCRYSSTCDRLLVPFEVPAVPVPAHGDRDR